MAKEHSIRVIRVPNHFSENAGDTLLRAERAGVKRDLGLLVQLLESRHIGLSKEVLLTAYEAINDLIVESMLEGYAVDTGIFLVEANITGNWPEGTQFNPLLHKLSFSAKLVKSVREKAKLVAFVLAGQMRDGDYASINGVLDIATGKTDKTFTVGDDIEITGDRIRVIGEEEDGVVEAEVGAFLVPATGNPIRIVRFNKNDPSLLNVRIPASVPVDKEYTLRIVTRFANTGGKLLTNLRTVEYPFKLTAKAG